MARKLIDAGIASFVSRSTTDVSSNVPVKLSIGGGVYTAGPNLEGVLLVRGPKLPRTGGRSTGDPLVITPDCSILVNVYTHIIILFNCYFFMILLIHIVD